MIVPPTAPICTERASVSTVPSPFVSVVVEARCRRGLMRRGGATRACARWPRRAARMYSMMEMYRIAAAALDAVGMREHYVERVVELVGSKFEELCNFKVFSSFK